MKLKKGISEITFFIFAVLLLGVIILAPLFKLDFIYTFFSAFCHQNPHRSFFIGSYPLPVCSRCFGIYTGFTVFSFYNLFIRYSFKKFFSFYLLFFIFSVGGLVIEKIGFCCSNIFRFLSAILSGISIGFFIFYPFSLLK